jgi:hypothetical protein
MIDEIMLLCDGISPAYGLSEYECHFLTEIVHKPMTMPLHDPPVTCAPFVRVLPEQKLMKFALSL